jgi:hypothetical protein
MPIVRAFVRRSRLSLSGAPPFGVWSASLALPTARTTTPSADFCAPIRTPYGFPSPVAGTARRSPEVSSTAFAAHSLNLRGDLLMEMDFAIHRPLVQVVPPHPVSVRRVAVLLHASFRRRLATPPLRFASTSPPSGCAGDFHPQAVEHARHTVAPVARNRCRAATRGHGPRRSC